MGKLGESCLNVCPATPSRLPEYFFSPLSSHFLLVAVVTMIAVRFGDWRQFVPRTTA